VDYAVVPSTRTSPSYTKNTAVGGILGIVLAAAFIILQYLLDENIHSEDYLTQTYPDIPLLAVVPDMTEGKNRDRGGYYAQPTQESMRSTKKKEKQPAERKPLVKQTNQEDRKNG
jgi:predicted outer membrane lipoprotein